MSNYDFVTDRLAIGNVASRAMPGFCAVVSLLATQPWDEVTGAPEVPNEDRIPASADPATLAWQNPSEDYSHTPVLHIDISDGETCRVRPDNGETYGNDLDTYLDNATSFIAAHLRRGCVLVHCGAGKSRSVAVVIAYLCRYAGMSFAEAAAFVAERRPGACPAPCFAEAIKRWLWLDELATKGPRKAGLRRLTELTEEMGGYDAEDVPSVNDQYTDEVIAQGR
jgi:hypothetical protein